MTLTMHTAAERPDLWDSGIPSASVWPEYNLHGDVLNRWCGHLDEDLREFQFVLYDEAGDEVVAEGHTAPLWWEGAEDALPAGIDSAIEQIFARVRAGQPVNTLCALAAEAPREGRARGLAEQLLNGDAHDRQGAGPDPLGRASPTYVEGALSADPDRALHPMAPSRWAAARSLDACPRAPRCMGLDPAAEVPANHRLGL